MDSALSCPLITLVTSCSLLLVLIFSFQPPIFSAASFNPSLVAVAPPTPAYDPYCDALTTPFDEVIVKMLHVGAPPHPPFYISIPPNFLESWAKLWLPGPIDTGMGYESFPRYLEGAPKDSLFLDIGAHVGVPALAVAAAGFRVVSFEPVPVNARNYRRAVCFNGWSASNATLVEMAVSNEDGEVTLYVPTLMSDNAALSQGASTANVNSPTEPTTVRMIMLDTWASTHLSAEEVAQVRLVKVDVQGSETRVVQGARALFSALHSDAWVVMEHDTGLISNSGLAPDADVQAMRELGFDVYSGFRGSMILAAKGSGSAAGAVQGLADVWYRRMTGPFEGAPLLQHQARALTPAQSLLALPPLQTKAPVQVTQAVQQASQAPPTVSPSL